MNKVTIIGRLTKDPEIRSTQNGVSVCTFTVAVDCRRKEDGADFLPVVAWRGTADVCGKYLSKGKQVAVFGSIQTRSYDAKDGSKRYVTEIQADEVEFLGSASKAENKTEQMPVIDGASDLQEVDIDDLPF